MTSSLFGSISQVKVSVSNDYVKTGLHQSQAISTMKKTMFDACVICTAMIKRQVPYCAAFVIIPEDKT